MLDKCFSPFHSKTTTDKNLVVHYINLVWCDGLESAHSWWLYRSPDCKHHHLIFHSVILSLLLWTNQYLSYLNNADRLTMKQYIGVSLVCFDQGSNPWVRIPQPIKMGDQLILPSRLVTHHYGETTRQTCVFTESVFYLTMPLDHNEFHVISYWTTSIWSLQHISLEETHCCDKHAELTR